MKKTMILAALAVALLLSAVSVASADVATYASGDPGTVTVNANVNSKLTLTITTTDPGVQTVDFGTVDPGSSYGSKSVGLNVKSNKAYDLTKSITDATPIGLSTSFTDVTGETKTASRDYTDDYTLDVPWDCAPGAHTATVVYTATQN